MKILKQEQFVWETIEDKNKRILNSAALPTATELFFRKKEENENERNTQRNQTLETLYGEKESLKTRNHAQANPTDQDTKPPNQQADTQVSEQANLTAFNKPNALNHNTPKSNTLNTHKRVKTEDRAIITSSHSQNPNSKNPNPSHNTQENPLQKAERLAHEVIRETQKIEKLGQKMKLKHKYIWGSWWNKALGWGYKCCYVTNRYGRCLGADGKALAVLEELKVKMELQKEELEKRKMDEIGEDTVQFEGFEMAPKSEAQNEKREIALGG